MNMMVITMIHGRATMYDTYTYQDYDVYIYMITSQPFDDRFSKRWCDYLSTFANSAAISSMGPTHWIWWTMNIHPTKIINHTTMIKINCIGCFGCVFGLRGPMNFFFNWNTLPVMILFTIAGDLFNFKFVILLKLSIILVLKTFTMATFSMLAFILLNFNL